MRIRDIGDLSGRGLDAQEILEVVKELEDPFVCAYWDQCQLLWGTSSEIRIILPVEPYVVEGADQIDKWTYTHGWYVSGGERLQTDGNIISVSRLTNRYGIATIFCKSVYVDHACLFPHLAKEHPMFKDVELIPWKMESKEEQS
jgi:hypothetical protein